MDRTWEPVPLDEVKAHLEWLRDCAEMVEAGHMEAVRYDGDAPDSISFRITPAGIRHLEAESDTGYSDKR